MSAPSSRPEAGANRLLASLPPASRNRLLARMEPVSLPLHHILLQPGDPIEHVYFLTSGVVSHFMMMDDGRGADSILTGCAGLIGIAGVMGDPISPDRTIVQIAGEALRIGLGDLLGLMDDPAIRRMLLRSAQIQLIQASRGTACNQLHPVEQRLARLLLHLHDLVASDVVPLTQDFLALMLGVRRPAVTVVAGPLQDAGLIAYHRGEITVRDRTGLERAACEDYAVVRDAVDRLLPLPAAGDE